MVITRLVFIFGAIIWPTIVAAIPIIQNFSGVQVNVAGEFINAVPVPLAQQEFAPLFAGSTTISGSIAYDTNQPDTDPSVDTGTYRIGSLSVNIPQIGLLASRASNNMQISAFDNAQPSNDQFFAFVFGVDLFQSTVGLPNPSSFDVLLFGSPSMLANDQLPTVPLDWVSGNASFDFLDSSQTAFRQVLLTFSPAQTVPEPTTLALLALGLAGAGFAFRRRSIGAA